MRKTCSLCLKRKIGIHAKACRDCWKWYAENKETNFECTNRDVCSDLKCTACLNKIKQMACDANGMFPSNEHINNADAGKNTIAGSDDDNCSSASTECNYILCTSSSSSVTKNSLSKMPKLLDTASTAAANTTHQHHSSPNGKKRRPLKAANTGTEQNPNQPHVSNIIEGTTETSTIVAASPAATRLHQSTPTHTPSAGLQLNNKTLNLNMPDSQASFNERRLIDQDIDDLIYCDTSSVSVKMENNIFKRETEQIKNVESEFLKDHIKTLQAELVSVKMKNYIFKRAAEQIKNAESEFLKDQIKSLQEELLSFKIKNSILRESEKIKNADITELKNIIMKIQLERNNLENKVKLFCTEEEVNRIKNAKECAFTHQ